VFSWQLRQEFFILADKTIISEIFYMLALERHRWVLDELAERGSVRTSQVAQSLGVTEETVRRDFEKLEADGMLLRSHGGAVRLEVNRQEFPVQARALQNIAAKQRIAEAALSRIKPGQTIYFDASTTVLQLAQLIPDQPLIVVTNGLQIATALAEKRDIQCVLLGGSLRPNSLSTGGWAAEKALEIYHLDAAFLSCRGVHPERGFSDASEVNARLKNAVISRSDEVILLADVSKAGVASSYFFAKAADVDLWIVDAAPPAPVGEAVGAQGLRILVAEES
jgi:DeoR/GlpR family transcriptional regulator of sugar metabolism